jgi:hypothetical protein
LPTEIVVDLQQMIRFRETLNELKYEPVPTGKFMHFEKQVPEGRVRLELLTGPMTDDELDKMHTKSLPRIRPKGDLELHAYFHPEAVGMHVEPLPVPLGEGVSVLVPNAFSFLVMKLHACNDRLEKENKQFGRHHALDVYRVLAMLTEGEVELVRRLRQEHRDAPAVRRAVQIAKELFSEMTSRGVVRMREHELVTQDMQIERALEILEELFGDTGS